MLVYFKIFLFVHIAAGTLALLAGSMSLFDRKGAKNHLITGRLFFWGILGVFITSVYMSIAKQNWFLLVTGFFSFYLACTGYRSLYLKKLHLGQRATWIDHVIGGSGILFGLGMYVLAYRLLPQNNFGIVPIVFGSISIYFGITDLLKFYRPSTKTQWITSHGFRMSGAYTATVTAFLVVNIHVEPSWIVWIAPSFIIPVIAGQQIRKYLKPIAKKAGVRN